MDKYQTSTFQADVILGWRRGGCETSWTHKCASLLMSFLVPTAKLHSPCCILGKLWNTCKDVDFVQTEPLRIPGEWKIVGHIILCGRVSLNFTKDVPSHRRCIHLLSDGTTRDVMV